MENQFELTNKMNVEIWSDIMCPFCYMGKKKFEIALEQFPHKSNIEVIWKSYLLQPKLETNPQISIAEYLTETKGLEPGEADDMNAHVAEAAGKIGLEFHFEKVVVANTLKAHKLLHYVKKENKQNETYERLFRAFFTEGLNIDDNSTLVSLAHELGINTGPLSAIFNSDEMTNEVRSDMYEAQQMGIRSVPFFIFNHKYAIKGAHEPALFLQTMEKAFKELHKKY